MCIEWKDSCISVSQKDSWENTARNTQTLIYRNIFISQWMNNKEEWELQSQMQLRILYLVVGFYRVVE